MDLKVLPNFFTKHMSSFFKSLIEQGFALVYIDDILSLSNFKEHMLQPIEHLHLISTKHILKLAPENLFSCYPESNSLDMKLVIIQLTLYTLKSRQFINFPLDGKVALEFYRCSQLSNTIH